MAKPQVIAADLADSVFGAQKIATGEMSQGELDASGREEWPLHYAIADALGGTVRPFDVYQGPYIELENEGRLFIYSEDGMEGHVWNEDTKESSEGFPIHEMSENEAVDAALSVLQDPDFHINKVEREHGAPLSSGHGQQDPNELNLTEADKSMLKGMNIGASLNNPLDGKGVKIASWLGRREDHPSSSTDLQAVVGDPLDQPISPFAQYHPNMGNMQTPNPLSPIQGDETFFMYLIPAAVFQSHDGQQWVIDSYTGGSYGVGLYNRWYPRQRAFVNVDDVRRSIHSWIEPVQVVVPPPPPGVTYYGQPVRVIDGKTHA